MSLSTDVLAKATPTRLVCRGGHWVLELTRLEAVDRDVYQPRLTRLEGPDSILAVLRRSEEGHGLATGAAQLMRSPRSDEDRAFEVNDGDWVPSADASLPARHAALASTDSADLARALAEVRAELAVLRASHSRLRERVIALEAAQSGLSVPNPRLPRGARSPRRRSEPPPGYAPAEARSEALAAENVGFAATQASPGLAPAGEPRRPSVPPAHADAVRATPGVQAPEGPHASLEELARSLAGEQLPPVLSLPDLRALTDCMATLLEAPPPLELQAKELNLEGFSEPVTCKLLDDEGRERGAIILDLRAALLLGAGLLAVPRDEALRQLKENDPSEDSLLATSEICNNLTGPVNAVAGNAHVRSTALSRVDVSTLPKLRARLDLVVDGGKLVLAMF
jgi:hypothetical protein